MKTIYLVVIASLSLTAQAVPSAIAKPLSSLAVDNLSSKPDAPKAAVKAKDAKLDEKEVSGFVEIQMTISRLLPKYQEAQKELERAQEHLRTIKALLDGLSEEWNKHQSEIIKARGFKDGEARVNPQTGVVETIQKVAAPQSPEK